MIRTKSKEELLRQILTGVTQETAITMVGKGSVTRGLASPIAGQISEVYSTLDDAITNSFLPTASGFFLDLFGESFGLIRARPKSSKVSAEDRVIKFYVNSGTLAALLPHPTNSGLGQIPDGTQISGANGIIYVVQGDHDFPASAKEVWVGADASGTGTGNNVGPGTLNSTNLAAGVNVTNVSAISTGTDLESDDEFRFRISRWIRTSAGKNEVSVTIAVLGAPGIADVIKQPYYAGAGSFRLILIPTGNRVPAESIRQIGATLSRITAEGTFFELAEPRYIPISIGVRLIPKATTSISPSDRDLVKAAILRYLGNIRPGQSLIVNQLRAAIINSSSNIGDLRIQGISINRKPQALVNYTLRSDELFIPDEEVQDPILVF